MSRYASKKRKRNDAAAFWTIREDTPTRSNLTVTHVDTLSSDGRRVSRALHKTYTELPDAVASRTTPSNYSEDADYAQGSGAPPRFSAFYGDTRYPTPQAWSLQRRPSFCNVHDPALLKWAEKHKDDFLGEFLRLEGLRGAVDETCATCGTPCMGGMFVCNDCFGGDRKFKWNGKYQESITLQDVGLVIQLGHPPGVPCPVPAPAPRNFTVLHTNGIHPVTLQFCNCDRVHNAGTRTQQLLRHELYGATTIDPSTCCTLRLLEQFHILTLQSKINAYDFYLSLEKLTDNTGRRKGTSRLKTFLRMVREYRHLKMLKRSGRGHEPGGAAATKPGELCVRCPACPRPGFNIPDNWEHVSDDLKFQTT
ncbi:hypothetical protein EIP86_000963 [Pleurotus ostreatoroseus]|nr:hypothetical protein EIP86_000963 [Pleurotus ostreatoroseus]